MYQFYIANKQIITKILLYIVSVITVLNFFHPSTFTTSFCWLFETLAVVTGSSSSFHSICKFRESSICTCVIKFKSEMLLLLSHQQLFFKCYNILQSRFSQTGFSSTFVSVTIFFNYIVGALYKLLPYVTKINAQMGAWMRKFEVIFHNLTFGKVMRYHSIICKNAPMVLYIDLNVSIPKKTLKLCRTVTTTAYSASPFPISFLTANNS